MIFPSTVALSLLVPITYALCPPPGPLLPPPSLKPSYSNFSIPDSAFNNLAFRVNTSFVIKASIGKTTVFQHEYSAPGREVPQPLFKTQSRVGSVTKMITALVLAMSEDKISLEDSITKFIPGLKKELYDDVTIGALASHTSGLGRFVRCSKPNPPPRIRANENS